MTSPQPAEAATGICPGDSAPNFSQRTTKHPDFAFDTIAGRYIVLCFFGSASDSHAQEACRSAYSRTDLFDEKHAVFFGVSIDPADETEARLTHQAPGYRHFYDFNLLASKLYGTVHRAASPADAMSSQVRQWVVIDPRMRVNAVIPFRSDRSDIAEVMALLEELPAPGNSAGIELMAPILYLPEVFEADLRERLIAYYEADGGQESGFMREIDGRTIGVSDHRLKRRKDVYVKDEVLIRTLQYRMTRRVFPEIAKAHQFHATRMERYVIACYSAADGGHFYAHRDNNSKGTAHRRFAISVNLNDDFDGGEVSFPEYGSRSFKAPAGGAVVFSCSLLHKVSTVTRGQRFAFLPFVYDEAAALVRQENARFIGPEKKDSDAAASEVQAGASKA